ncbi:MAG: hypothetical protein JO246_07155 [Frankiaceae bacterium]|nr:hypothetical protein [Frankiaceae bacterium]
MTYELVPRLANAEHFLRMQVDRADGVLANAVVNLRQTFESLTREHSDELDRRIAIAEKAGGDKRKRMLARAVAHFREQTVEERRIMDDGFAQAVAAQRELLAAAVKEFVEWLEPLRITDLSESQRAALEE